MAKATKTNPLESDAVYVRQEIAAERWDVSVDTIRRLIRDGKITGYRLNNRIIRVAVDEVDAVFRPIPSVKVG